MLGEVGSTTAITGKRVPYQEAHSAHNKTHKGMHVATSKGYKHGCCVCVCVCMWVKKMCNIATTSMMC
jgi:hypothetical protein